nr:cadherin-like beta sandwich domain-containing protein [Maliibacterium massiliense]
MKMKKRLLSVLLAIAMALTLLPMTALAAPPKYNPWYTPDSGTATPASPSGNTAAVPYVFTAKPLLGGNGLFTEATKYKADFISPVEGADYGTVTFEDNGVQYTPNANAAGQTIQFKVFAGNDQDEWSTGGITFTVSVKPQPTDANNNANLTALSYQIGSAEPIPVPNFTSDNTDYTVVLPEGTPLGQTISLLATLEDPNADIETTTARTAWEYSFEEAAAVVTAENGATQKTYMVHFHVKPTDREPSVYSGIERYQDGSTVVVGTNETKSLWVSLGAGDTQAGSCHVKSSDLDVLFVNAISTGVYPNVSFSHRLNLDAGKSADLTINFYDGDYTTDQTLQPTKTMVLHVVSHDHSWAANWSKDEEHHWHECTADCPITDNSLKDSFVAHFYGQQSVSDQYKATDATCTAAATYYKSCVCGAMGTETFTSGQADASNHTSLVKTEAKDATHLEAGNKEYWYCDGCKKYFSDEAGTKEIFLESTVIPKLPEHTADDTGWHSDEANHWNICECGEVLNKAAHTYEWVVDKEATATKAGTKHEKCTVCGYEKAAVEIPAAGTDSPQTGDNSHPLVWTMLAFLSGVAVLTLTLKGKRKTNQ